MPDEPISALTQIAAPSGSPPYPTAFTNPTTGAMLEILDTTNTSMATTGTNSKIAPGDLIKGYLAAGTNITLTETAGVVTVTASGGSPGGSSGQIQTNNGSGGFGALAVPLPVASGGTGLGTLTANAVVLGEGTSTPGFATIGTAGRLLIDQGAAADPAFKAMSSDATITSAGAVTIAAGAVTLAKQANLAASSLQGNPTGSPAAPSAITLAGGLAFSGTTVTAASLAPLASPTFTGTVTLPAGTVTLAEQANFAASSLMGNPTGSPAAPSAITLGANLSFSGTTLVATAGGGMTNPMTTTGDIIYSTTTASPGAPGRLGIGSTGNVLTVAGGLPSWAAPATAGTVTSVGLSTNAGWLTVGSSPVTSSGTITVNATTGQTANQVLATPDGTTGVAGLRALVTGDIPTLAASKVTAPGSTGQLVYNSSNVLTGAADWTVGASGQLVGTGISAPAAAIGTLWLDSTRGTYGICGGNSSAGINTMLGGTVWQAIPSGNTPFTTATNSNATSLFSLLQAGTTIGSLTFPANSLTPGKFIRVNFFGTMAQPSGPPTLTVQLMLGGNIIWGFNNQGCLTTTTASFWEIGSQGNNFIHVQSVGATGKILGFIQSLHASAATALSFASGLSSSLVAVNAGWFAGSAISIDTTSSLTLDLQLKYNTGVAGSSMQLLGGYVEVWG